MQWQIAFRQLLRKPGFALTAIALLAGGIAASTTVFSLVATILLKPLPYPNPERLVYVHEANAGKQAPLSLMAPVRVEDWNRLNRTFVAIAGYYYDTQTDRTGSVPERLRCLSVSPRYFSVYETRPLIGRTFSPAEETASGPNAVILSYAFWKQRFLGSPQALNSRLRLGNDAYTVIGVMPANFVSPNVDIWLSAKLGSYLRTARDVRFYNGVGRLQPNVKLQMAKADLARVQQQLGQDFPQTDAGWSAVVSDMRETIVGDHGRFVWLAFGGVGILMLLACTNIAGLMLGQLQKRRNELAVRGSLGATRLQLVGTILREATLIAAVGVAAGTLTSSWAIAAAVKTLTTLPRIAELDLDWRALIFVSFLGILTILLVGLIPALQASQPELLIDLRQGDRTATRRCHGLLQGLLVVQFAITIVLLISAGLLIRSYQRLTQLNAGFSPDHVLTFHVGAEWGEDRSAIGKLQQEILTALKSTPGVSAAGIANFLPTDEGTLRYRYQMDGLGADQPDHAFTAGSRTVSGGYLAALRVPVLAGETCPDLPINTKQPARALVNRSFADRFGRSQSLPGRQLRVLGTEVADSYEVVGVIGDVREDSLRSPAVPYVYLCSMAGGWPDPEYVLRTSEDPSAFANTLRKMIAKIAPDRALFGVKTMQDHVEDAIEQPRLTAQLLTGFAIAAITLAAFGLYSLSALLVTTRTREIGTRMALGAGKWEVVTSVLADALKTIGFALLLGFALSLAVGRGIQTLLFETDAFDPATLASVCGLLTFVCLTAMLFPALRAASVNPVQAMREQ